MSGDDRTRRRGTTREESELRAKLLSNEISLATFNRRYNNLRLIGLIQRNGKPV